MPSRKTRLTDLLQGVGLVDRAQWERLRKELAPISDGYLRRLLRASGTQLTPDVEGIRQENFAELERTLLAATDRRLVLEAKRHAELARRSPKVDQPVKQEMLEWIRVWLETPDAFAVWVKLRKANPDWQRLTGARRPAP